MITMITRPELSQCGHNTNFNIYVPDIPTIWYLASFPGSPAPERASVNRMDPL